MAEKIVIDKSLEAEFKYEIAARPGGENIKKCFACGTCTAGCPVFQVEHEYNPRRIIRMILLGLREKVLRSKALWLCSQCYTCTANCPQEVDFSAVMLALRDLALAAGYAPAELPERIEAIGEAAQRFRRDCIHLLLGEGEASPEAILGEVEKTLAGIVRKG